MFKKFVSLFLALVISLSTVTVFAYAENEEAAPSKREQLPVKIEFAYAPLKSRIVIGNFGPLFAGMVIKATYADGTSELLTVKKTDCGYMAGDFNVDWSYYFFYLGIVDPTIINYGLVSGVFRIIKDCDESSYYIGEELFTYLNLPSPAETVYLINFYAKTIGAVLKNALGFN